MSLSLQQAAPAEVWCHGDVRRVKSAEIGQALIAGLSIRAKVFCSCPGAMICELCQRLAETCFVQDV